jgi:acyl-coenzyme A thioesterase PaaI-like protein
VPIEGRGRIVADKRRLIDVEAKIVQDGALAFASTFKFVVLDKSGAERMLGGPLPPSWERFCR